MRLIILPQGLAPHGAGNRVAADHAQQGHDTYVDHHDPGRRSTARSIINNTAGSPFIDPGGPQAPILQVFIVVGAMFVIFNLALSRLSRRLEIRERKRTGTTTETVTGLEDQVALDADVA